MTAEKGAVGEAAAELAQEQAYVTMLYERLDAMRAGTARRLAEVRLGPTAENDQGWSEREMFAQEYVDRGAELDAAERNLCFGRLDFEDGMRFYIGRIGLRSEDYDQLLVDWRARAAERFYRATPKERYGVTRRRHLHTAVRQVVSLDDDVLDLDAVDETRLAGEAAGRAARQRDAADEAERVAQLEYADQLVSKLVSDGSIFVPRLEHDTFVSWIARRNNADDEPRGMLAERALRDRTWASGT